MEHFVISYQTIDMITTSVIIFNMITTSVTIFIFLIPLIKKYGTSTHVDDISTTVHDKNTLINGFKSGKIVGTFDRDGTTETITLCGHPTEISALSLYTNTLASGYIDGTIMIWDIGIDVQDRLLCKFNVNDRRGQYSPNKILSLTLLNSKHLLVVRRCNSNSWPTLEIWDCKSGENIGDYIADFYI